MPLKIETEETQETQSKRPDPKNASLPKNAKELIPEVDELAELLEWESSIKKDTRSKRLAELKKKFQSALDDYSGEEEYELHGSEHVIQMGKKSNTTKITDKSGIKDMLGEDTFFEIVAVPVTPLKDYLTKKQLDMVTETERSGSRSIKHTKKG